MAALWYLEAGFSSQAPVFSEALPKQLRDEHFSAAHASSRRRTDCHGEAGLMGNVTSKSETQRGRLFSDRLYVIEKRRGCKVSDMTE